MFSPLTTHYYWEETREDIYRSAPSKVRICRRNRRGRQGRRAASASRDDGPECLSHGASWKARFEQVITSLRGRILPEREDAMSEMEKMACSCADRDREKCKDAIDRFGFTIGSNLPPNEITNRIRFTELYYHNILNSPQFREDYMKSINDQTPYSQVVQGLYENRLVIFALVQRCVLNNDKKAYRILDMIRQYIQRQCKTVYEVPLPDEQQEAIALLQEIDENDHVHKVQKLYGCNLCAEVTSNNNNLYLLIDMVTANVEDLHAVKEYFSLPIGVKLKPQIETKCEKEKGDEKEKTEGEAEEKSGDINGGVIADNGETSETDNPPPEDSEETSPKKADTTYVQPIEVQNITEEVIIVIRENTSEQISGVTVKTDPDTDVVVDIVQETVTSPEKLRILAHNVKETIDDNCNEDATQGPHEKQIEPLNNELNLNNL